VSNDRETQVAPQAGDSDVDGAIPPEVLLALIRDVWDSVEVKVVLTVALLGGLAAPISEQDLAHEALERGVRGNGSDRDVRERIAEAVELATARGVLIRLAADDGSRWLLLGTDANKRRVRKGISVDAGAAGVRVGVLRPERPTIFALYEQNVGLVTPIIADRLVEALERYPERWIEDAIAEAVNYNRRSWRYIQRILENWATEGRNDETDWRSASRDQNREKHLRGKYAALFRRDDVPDLPGRRLPADGRTGQ
jgi:DnaD/phage-associated family protein